MHHNLIHYQNDDFFKLDCELNEKNELISVLISLLLISSFLNTVFNNGDPGGELLLLLFGGGELLGEIDGVLLFVIVNIFSANNLKSLNI